MLALLSKKEGRLHLKDINHFVNVRQPQCLLNEGDLLFLLSKASIASIASPELGKAQPQLVSPLVPDRNYNPSKAKYGTHLSKLS